MYYLILWGIVMQYSVHIYSTFNALIFKNSDFLKETNLKNGLHLNIDTEKDNTFLVYSSQTFLGYKFLPYAININEILQKNNNNLVKLKNYVGLNTNICEIVLTENLIYNTNCENIKNLNLQYNKHNFYVEVFNSFIKINNVTFYLKHYFFSSSCSVELVNNFIVVLYQNSEKYYCLIFNLKENIIILEFENIVNKFELDTSTSTVKILTNHNSFYKTGLVKKYLLNDVFEEQEHYFVKLGNFNTNLNLNIIPFAFMQCVMLKDYNLAKNFLCSELSSKLNSTTLSNYFLNLEDFEKCKYCPDENCLFVKFKGEVNYKPIRFVMQNNKIVDIK